MSNYSDIKDYLIIGSWLLAVYLSYNSFKRSETYRAKDKIIDRLDKLQEWVAKEVKSVKDKNEQIKTMPVIENYTASKITQIELRLSQFNSYVGKKVVDETCVVKVRCIDFYEDDLASITKNVNSAFSDVIETIECQFEKHVTKGIALRFSSYYKESIYVATMLLSMYVLLLILRHFFG